MNDEERKRTYEFEPFLTRHRLALGDMDEREKKMRKDWEKGNEAATDRITTANQPRNLRVVKSRLLETILPRDRRVLEDSFFLGLGTMDGQVDKGSMERHFAAIEFVREKLRERFREQAALSKNIRLHFWDPEYSTQDAHMIRKFLGGAMSPFISANKGRL
ncbi:hypothetical protein BCR34DRAFT_582643 [Clohesyomyces aquaticus]|uniref:Uncharacterized protein n=1 Tax=Clohesyomyces aquaticus TaxID=1231657 RepID=A0A1Y2A845_9PLEO|nr:hypothetical protein BCR34DRAFT_582643 [Clohesyomyces aquaticus]